MEYAKCVKEVMGETGSSVGGVVRRWLAVKGCSN